MSGWGGDDVDFYRRLRRRGLKADVFAPESFHETTQPMEGKNREAPRIDSAFVENQPLLASQPRFSGVRNTLLSVLHRQTRNSALRYRFTRDAQIPHLVHARLRQRSSLDLALGRYSIELANILTIHHFQPDVHPRDILGTSAFQNIRHDYQLPRPRNRQERHQLIHQLPEHLLRLRVLAKQLGVPTLPL